ncbi:translationally-controlled tumor protein [Kitasatospora sp. NPDC101183]|uniref:translationally-controlled tumor protein n=1 Tax=Kitasatospora sp. NPDC101183 TaxID=3364100 RepID=UPI003818587E
MKVYKDVFNGDELLSDSFPIKEDGICYVVEGKYVTRETVGTVDIGGASSAEDDVEDAEESPTITVLNIVDAHRLVETSYDKKSYTGHIKAYLKRLTDKLAADGQSADQRSAWQQQAQEWVKAVLADFDSYRFFTGEQMDPEAMVVLLKLGEDGKTPFLYFIRDGLRVETY